MTDIDKDLLLEQAAMGMEPDGDTSLDACVNRWAAEALEALKSGGKLDAVLDELDPVAVLSIFLENVRARAVCFAGSYADVVETAFQALKDRAYDADNARDDGLVGAFAKDGAALSDARYRVFVTESDPVVRGIADRQVRDMAADDEVMEVVANASSSVDDMCRILAAAAVESAKADLDLVYTDNDHWMRDRAMPAVYDAVSDFERERKRKADHE